MRLFRLRSVWRLVVMAVAVAGAPDSRLLAQSAALVQHDPGPIVGVRATGMGGAFTAVADDGSAVFWNPAGLATGSFFSLLIDGSTFDRHDALLVAIGTPPLGLAYYRTATADVKNGRHTLVAHHAGVTLVQSIGDRLAVGSTLKLVHGVASLGAGSISTNKFDADLGVITTGSFAQLGLSVHNLLQPTFEAGTGGIRLDRRVRAGVSVHARQDTIVAADVDLTKSATPRGDWRDVAVGLESHPVRAAWLRGGMHWNAAGGDGAGAAPIASLGGSYAVYGSLLADGQVSFGSSSGDRGWGIGLRFVF